MGFFVLVCVCVSIIVNADAAFITAASQLVVFWVCVSFLSLCLNCELQMTSPA